MSIINGLIMGKIEFPLLTISMTPRSKIEPKTVPTKLYSKVTAEVPSAKPQIQKDEVSNYSKYVVFCIGREKEKMYGLKSKLVAKSQIFYEVVYARKEINHPEFRPAVFREFLKFINTDELYIDENHVSDLLRLAFLYEIPQIASKCLEFAKKTLNLNNCVKYHLAATLYELGELESLCFKFILSQGQGFLTHPSFLDLDPLTLGSIIGRDDFNIIETDLFRCILAWIGAECKRLNYPPDRKEFHRRVCGNLFQNIRFSLMTPKEFINIVIPTGILGPKDIEAVNLRHTTHPNLWPTLPPSNHLDRHRRPRLHLSIPIYGAVQFGYRRNSSPNIKECIRFLASQTIAFVGIGFYGPARNGSGSPLTSFKIKYQIENEFMSFYWKTLPESTSVVTSDDFEIDFAHPYKVEGRNSYKLTVWIEGQMSQFGANPVPQAGILYDHNCISFLLSGEQADKEKHSTIGTDPSGKLLKYEADRPGVIKSLLFQTL